MNWKFEHITLFLSATSLLEALQVESVKGVKSLKGGGADTFEITEVSVIYICFRIP